VNSSNGKYSPDYELCVPISINFVLHCDAHMGLGLSLWVSPYGLSISREFWRRSSMAEQSTSGVSRPEAPEHRQPPPPWAVARSPYVIHIKWMRDQVDAAAIRADPIPFLPIDHALETIPNFHCSKSSWTQERLTRFQVVVFEGQEDPQLFPEE